ncbi:hypothetical protein CR513_33850, partial [Mucuna pruriens]
MESDCCQHVKKCMKCQVYAYNIHMAPFELHNLTSLRPFAMWGLDMIGPIEPKASNGHRFILVVIDYFTKWVEVASYDHSLDWSASELASSPNGPPLPA